MKRSRHRDRFESNGSVSLSPRVQIKNLKELLMVEDTASIHGRADVSAGASSSTSREMIKAASFPNERQNGLSNVFAQHPKKFKSNNTRAAEEISSQLKNGGDTEFSNNDIYNTFLFHDDPSHRNQTDNDLSVNSTPKDWVSLFFTETFYEMMECKGDWDRYSGSTKDPKIYLALLLQMGSVKLPEIVQYWRKERTHFCSDFWRDNMSIDDFIKSLPSDEDYCKAFVEAVNGSLEEFCHSKIGYGSASWRGKVGIRRYYDPTRKKVEGFVYVLAETDGLILKIILKKESERPKSVDILLELLKKACGFGKLFNRADVYVGMELAVVSKDDAKERSGSNERMNSNWKFIDIEVKRVALGDGSSSGQQRELLLVNLVKTRDAMEELDGFNNVFLTNVDFANRCRNWSRQSWRSRAIVDVINLTVNAAYVLSLRHNQCDDRTLLEFRHDLVESILTEALTSKPDVNEDASECPIQLGPYVDDNDATSQDGVMEPIALSPQEVMSIESVDNSFSEDYLIHALILISEEKPRPRRRCRRCYKNGIRKETSYMCAACPGQYVLCQSCHPEHLDEIIRGVFHR